jgi:hypothetical protein
MAESLSALRAGPFLLISVRGWVDPRAIVRLEGLGTFKKSTSSGIRTCDLPACSIVPQPTTLPRAPSTADPSPNLPCILVLIIIPSLIYTHLLWPPDEWDSPKQAAHHQIVQPYFGGFISEPVLGYRADIQLVLVIKLLVCLALAATIINETTLQWSVRYQKQKIFGFE